MLTKLRKKWDGLPESRRDLLCLALLIGVTIALFYKTIFLGQPISRVFALANQDILFRDQWAGVPSVFDRASFLMKIAHYLFVAELWRDGILPLWNPYNGCGVPLVGELQAIVFAPWMLIYPFFPTLEAHNLLLVAQQALGAVGVFLAARALGLSRYGSIFASLAHLLCPHQLWREELQMNHYFYPMAVWAFIRLAQSPGLKWAFIAGAWCAAIVVSGDAQVSMLSILVASFFFGCLCLFDKISKARWYQRAGEGILWLALAGINTVCLSAPVFLTFVEYFLHCDVPKRHAYYSVGNEAPWQALSYSLTHPGFGGASPFLGIVAVPLICVSLFALKPRRRWYLSVMVTSIVAFWSASRTGPFLWLDQHTGLMGLSRFEGMEPFLMQLCFLMAFGLEELVASLEVHQKQKLAVLFLSAIVVIAAPWMLNAYTAFDLRNYSFDSHLPSIGYNSRAWLNDLLVLSAVPIAMFLHLRFRSRLPLLGAVLLIAINWLSEGGTAKLALPVQPAFKYAKVEPLPFLAHANKRIIQVGYHLLLPNTNLVYRIPSVEYHGPVTPERLNIFINAIGGKADGFNAIFPRGTFSTLVDLTAARYFLSLSPVIDAASPDKQEKFDLGTGVSFRGNNDLRLVGASLSYDAKRSQVLGFLDWKIKPGTGEKYGYLISVFDEKGNTFWTGGPFYVRERAWRKDDSRPHDFSRTAIEAILPLDVPVGAKFNVGIYVIDNARANYIQPASRTFASNRDLILIGGYRKIAPPPLSASDRFRLVSETGRSKIRIYENLKARPEAYIVHDIVPADSGASALAKVLSSQFKPDSQAVVEGKMALECGGGGATGSGADRVEYSRPDPNSLDVNVTAGSDGLLVVADTFFPGWQATVDGRKVDIQRVNYLFKGVPVSAGTHKVRFVYQPLSFLLGVALFGGCLALHLVALLVALIRRRNRSDRELAAPSDEKARDVAVLVR